MYAAGAFDRRTQRGDLRRHGLCAIAALPGRSTAGSVMGPGGVAVGHDAYADVQRTAAGTRTCNSGHGGACQQAGED